MAKEEIINEVLEEIMRRVSDMYKDVTYGYSLREDDMAFGRESALDDVMEILKEVKNVSGNNNVA